MMMYTFATIAAQLFLALSAGAPTAAADSDFIGSVVAAPTSPKVNRRIQQAECVCSPTMYTFRLNFEGSCAVDTIQGNPGVSDTTCSVLNSSNPNDEDGLTPVQINSLQFLELDAANAVAQQISFTGLFSDGESFEYTSISVGNEVPGGMQISLRGENAE
eukprot:scaffold5994_cov100-Skeletonema_marinoi.AAC.3